MKILTDNTCDKSYINNIGAIKSKKKKNLTRKIWFCCMNRNIWIAAYLDPDKNNVVDKFSRELNDLLE